MNKKILNLVLLGVLTISVMAFGVVVASTSDTKLANATDITLMEITSSVSKDGESILSRAFGSKSYVDGNGDRQTIPAIEGAEYKPDKAIKKYKLENSGVIAKGEDIASVYDSLSENFIYIIPIEKDGVTVGQATMNKGLSVAEVEKKLEGKSFKSDSAKAGILDRAKTRENKWYVAAVQKTDPSKSFIGIDSATSALSAKNIGTVRDVKYAYFSVVATEIVSVKTDAGEYVIPYGVPEYAVGIENGNAYTVGQINQAIKATLKTIQ